MAETEPPRPSGVASAARSPAPPTAGRPKRPFLAVFPSVMLPMFMALIDQTIVVTALPAIAGAFGQVERLSWVVIAYLIAATVAAPVFGRLGDLLGRRRLSFVALGIFAGASLLCAFSISMEMLTFGRLLQGLGGGGMMTLSQALIGEAVPPRDRARYQGFLAAIGVSSSTLGPVAGGFLTEYVSWRAIFLVNVPLAILALLLLLRLPARRGSGEPLKFDYQGMLLFATMVASTLLVLDQAQHFQTSDRRLGMVLAAAAVASLGLLILRERRAPAPLLPVQLLRHPAIWRCDALAACHGAMLVSLLTFVPIYLRVARDQPVAQIGMLLLPMTVGAGVGSLITGRIVGRTGRAALMPSIGTVVVAILLGLIAWLAPRLSTAQFAWMLGFNALFLGTIMGVVQVTVQTAAGPAMLGATAASVQFSRTLGAAFGTALVAAVLFAILRAADPAAGQLFGSLLQDGFSALDALPEPSGRAVEAAIADAFRAAFLTIMGFAVAAIALSWTIPLRRI